VDRSDTSRGIGSCNSGRLCTECVEQIRQQQNEPRECLSDVNSAAADFVVGAAFVVEANADATLAAVAIIAADVWIVAAPTAARV